MLLTYLSVMESKTVICKRYRCCRLQCMDISATGATACLGTGKNNTPARTVQSVFQHHAGRFRGLKAVKRNRRPRETQADSTAQTQPIATPKTHP